ncbi:M20 family peptidase [Siminovitchia acidinfaciens]|uniref:M20 family peptidase n=1 Tax=Siminovitchia acidinfaciens TaxID=2321395 RepID=A0A429Y7F4_9BACI|nr:M20 family metallopeptidase [Siminovitchia acidinfaciens]RST77389.1 M20 family peptidase [Siminovitchia acidinfaciens]
MLVQQKSINDFIEQNENEIFNLLKKIVNTDSYSRDREGVNRVAALLKQGLDEFSIPYVTREQEQFGDHIIATLKGTRPGKILLMGHMDTVHTPGTVKDRPYTENGNIAFGPGLSDMKAGLVSILYAAGAVKNASLDLPDIEILYTPDEEIGSPTSRAIIEERAKDAMAVFNLESGRADGSVVTARKGSAHLSFEIEGKASHSGLFIEEGISANDELACKMVELRKLMDMERGITINVGTISGGVNTNVVSPHASATLHVGFWRIEDYKETEEKIKKIIDTSYIKGTKATLSGSISFQPMEKHEGVAAMYDLVKKAGESLGIEVTEEATKGAADAGFPAALGIPTICGMGPVGGKWHSKDEYMEIDSYIPRIQLLANSIVLAADHFSDSK